MEEAYLQKFLQKFDTSLKIPLEEIISATNNFDDKKCIGCGGFGKVYAGEVSHSQGRSMVAIKRLDRTYGQGETEFLKEITVLSDYKHENIISLVGFCFQGGEMILVYELASRGSLDRYLESSSFTWRQRLKICLDAAKGISYLHDPRDTHRRLIHCDVKSANILLDDQWNAKVSDFGLAIVGSANEQYSVIVTLAAGSKGYIDPQYLMTHTLTKGSDTYSFGVVLFEVLCGRVCHTFDCEGNVQSLVPTWKKCYEQKKLNDITFKSPTIQPLDRSSLEKFSDIAYRCLGESRKDRPTMADVVTKLKTALQIQEFSEGNSPFDYEEITKTAIPPVNYRSKGELWERLSSGVLLNNGKTWFSFNNKGEHCEMISFAECLDPEFKGEWSSEYDSKFSVGTYPYRNGSVKTRVKTQFLSPGITYTVNLVFQVVNIMMIGPRDHISLKYRLQGEKNTSISYIADEREDGWWMCELYQFTSDHSIVDLQIRFAGFTEDVSLYVQGIEFRPLEKVEHKTENQPISGLDANWEEQLPADYTDMIKRSKNRVQWTTTKEAYLVMREGFLINKGAGWFYLDKNGKKCHMLSAKVACRMEGTQWCQLSEQESRFGVAIQFDFSCLIITSGIDPKLLSPETKYASYLVYKLPKDQSGFVAPMKANPEGYAGSKKRYIYLVSPQIPVIRPKDNENPYNPLSRPKVYGLPQQRNDGWMEVKIWEFPSNPTTRVPMRVYLSKCNGKKCTKLIVEGIEFRPI